MMRSVIYLALLLSITACMVKCAWSHKVMKPPAIFNSHEVTR